MAGILRATLDGLAKFLGAEPHQAEVVYSERSARAAFSRRGLFKAAGAVAAGTLFADVAAEAPRIVAAEQRLFAEATIAFEGPVLVHPSSHARFLEFLKASYSDARIQALLYGDLDPLLSQLAKTPIVKDRHAPLNRAYVRFSTLGDSPWLPSA